jgi:hypothetical protein
VVVAVVVALQTVRVEQVDHRPTVLAQRFLEVLDQVLVIVLMQQLLVALQQVAVRELAVLQFNSPAQPLTLEEEPVEWE